ISQLPGSRSALTSRSGVTSAARAGTAASATALASRWREIAQCEGMCFLPEYFARLVARMERSEIRGKSLRLLNRRPRITRPQGRPLHPGYRASQSENEQHGLVAHLTQFGRELVAPPCDRAQPGQNRNVLLAAGLERHRRGIEAGADVDLPQRFERGGVIGDECSVGETGEHQPARSCERRAVVGIGAVNTRLDLAGERIGDDDIGLVALDMPERGALPVARLVGQAGIERDLVAG